MLRVALNGDGGHRDPGVDQARSGGPREDCWRVGPGRAKGHCAEAAGTGAETGTASASAGSAVATAGAALCANGHDGSALVGTPPWPACPPWTWPACAACGPHSTKAACPSIGASMNPAGTSARAQIAPSSSSVPSRWVRSRGGRVGVAKRSKPCLNARRRASKGLPHCEGAATRAGRPSGGLSRVPAPPARA